MFFATVEIRVQTAEHLLICSYLYIRTVVSIMSYMSYLKFFIAILFKKCNVQYNTIILQVFVSHFYLMSTKFLYPWITKVSFLSDNLCSVHLFFQDVIPFHDQSAFLGLQQLYAYCRPNPRAKYLHHLLAGESTVQLYHLVPKLQRQLLVNVDQTTNISYELCKVQATWSCKTYD